MAFDVNKHFLIPKHTKLNDSEKSKLLEKYNINSMALPKIMDDDPAIAKLDAKVGDVIKIERKSKTSGVTTYYRLVIEG
ncbi:MAG: DNA-directed RNA polymerase subunit H [Candidatus Woesearchaeota archaeon]